MNKALISIIACVFALDRFTKYLIERHIPLEGNVDVIPGFFRLTYLQNPGSAFSFFAASPAQWRTPALILFAVAALAVLCIMLWRDRRTNMTTIALSLVFAGALGNLWDRLASGAVTDFLDFYIDGHHWYPFNIADSAIVAGAILLAWRVFFHSQEKRA